MKIGDLIKTQGGPALVLGVTYGYEDAPVPGNLCQAPSELQVQFLQTLETRWVLAYEAEVLSENR